MKRIFLMSLFALVAVFSSNLVNAKPKIKGSVTVNRSSEDFCFSKGKGCKIKIEVSNLTIKSSTQILANIQDIDRSFNGRVYDGFEFDIVDENTGETIHIVIPTQELIWSNEYNGFLLNIQD